VAIEELGDEVIVKAAPGESATGEVTLEPGEYTYYCSVPGHRTTMEGTLTVEEGAGEAAGGGGASESASEGSGGDASESGESETGSSGNGSES
jgi:hypothetical protein